MDKMIITWYDQVAASYTSDLNSPMYERAAKNAKTEILLILILVTTTVQHWGLLLNSSCQSQKGDIKSEFCKFGLILITSVQFVQHNFVFPTLNTRTLSLFSDNMNNSVRIF